MATLLAEHFPHPRAPLNSHIHYLRHAIKVLDYAPKFEQQLLGLVIDRILQIDVHVQKEDIEAVAPIDSQSMVFQMDANPNEESGDPIAVASLADGSLSAIREPPDSDDELDSDTDGTATFAVDQNEMIIKLDSLMVVAFDYLSATFRKLERGPDSNQRLAPDKAAILRARELQSILLDIFDRTIIRSVRSRHVQFLLFYTCSFSDQFADDFLSLLVHKSMDPALPALHRMSAASYVGSFIARAKYIPIDRICESLGVLADWASSYVRKFESPTVVPDHRKYGVFYAVVQAVLYIFVFRWKEVTAAQEDSAGNLRWPRELQSIPSILNSRFRPLKVRVVEVLAAFWFLTVSACLR